MSALLTEAQAAELLATTPGHLAYLRKSRRGPAFVKIGRQVRYHPEALSAYCRARTFAPSTRPGIVS